MCEDNAKFCSNCASSDFDLSSILSQFFNNENQSKIETYVDENGNTCMRLVKDKKPEAFVAASAATAPKPAPDKPAPQKAAPKPKGRHGDIKKGILGATLLSLIGVVIAFILFQLGSVASLSAIAMFYCAGYGYAMFAKVPHNSTCVQILVSTIVTAVMIYFAEYLCIAFEYFKHYISWDISLFNMLRYSFESAGNDMTSSGVEKDLAFSYLLAGINLLLLGWSYLKAWLKAKKAAKK